MTISIVGMLVDDADPMVSVMKFDKAPLESYAGIGKPFGGRMAIRMVRMGIRTPKGVILYGEHPRLSKG